jgi:hypothetical protein
LNEKGGNVPESKRPTTLVIYNPLAGWDVRDEESHILIAHYLAQDEAIAKAREISAQEHTDIFIVTKSKRIPILEFYES